MANSKDLIRQLKQAGIGDRAINAAWPAWWSEQAEASKAAQADLRFTIARNLGLAPKALIGDRVEFVWKDQARFKHLGSETENQKAALTSFGLAVGKTLLSATPETGEKNVRSAAELRELLLRQREVVDLPSMLAFCWSVGIPVVHLRVFPLNTKAMHAMVVRNGGRFAILLGRDASYPAPLAFTLAHEIGHINLGHLHDVGAIVDLEDSAADDSGDDQENTADKFALELLTGSSQPDIRTNIDNPSARALADAVKEAAPKHRIEPGTLALCLAYRTGNWPTAMAALRHIYPQPRQLWEMINGYAAKQLDLESLATENTEYLERVLGLADE